MTKSNLNKLKAPEIVKSNLTLKNLETRINCHVEINFRNLKYLAKVKSKPNQTVKLKSKLKKNTTEILVLVYFLFKILKNLKCFVKIL